jgi:hypothetical protein
MKRVVGAVLGSVLALAVLGLIGGIAFERYSFDAHRAKMPTQPHDAVSKVIAAPTQDNTAPWEPLILRMNEALGKNDLLAAERAWRQAHVEALASLSWEGMIEVGAAALRLGEAGGYSNWFEIKARRIYSTALDRARRAPSLEGMARVEDALARLDRKAGQLAQH